jgi:hypothetical protein
MRWIQPDTVIPNIYNPLDLDRFAYVRNNPINFNDPYGHYACEDSFYGCGTTTDTSRINGSVVYWKWAITSEFGIIMSDAGDKKWDVSNLRLMSTSLSTINIHLNGKFKSLVGGAVFKLRNQDENEGFYHGWTQSEGIDFYTIGTNAIFQMNIYHEVGHLLDSVPRTKNVFRDAVSDEDSPSWVLNKIINSDALIEYPWVTDDLTYSNVQALQTYRDQGPAEQWADAFANYIACNIDFFAAPGAAMYNFVYGALAPYIGLR